MTEVKVAITIDTEEDQWGQYSARPCTVKNTYSVPLIQDIFDRYGAVPTYLVNYPVMTDGRASAMFEEIMVGGRCELGVHCHPWNTPPQEDENNTEFSSFLCNLSYSKIWSKMRFLRDCFIRRFDVKPASFRAGRWGFGPLVARAIMDLGYTVDTSISPLVDWTCYGGPDFFNAPRLPYRLKHPDAPLSPGSAGILEAPPTVGFFQKHSDLSAAILRQIKKNGFLTRLRLIGILDRYRVINLRWLSPETTSSRDMATLAQKRIDCGESFLNMFFHSTSLLPAMSPFVRDNQELQDFLTRIQRFLEFASAAGWKFTALKNIVPDDE
jgi:hypothetical protein